MMKHGQRLTWVSIQDFLWTYEQEMFTQPCLRLVIHLASSLCFQFPFPSFLFNKPLLNTIIPL